MADAVFQPAGERFRPTAHSRGPWDPQAQHGGAPAALIVRALERHEDGPPTIARVTFELMRPVPLGELELRVSRLRGGRRVALLEASLLDADGTEVVRARALKLLPAAMEAGTGPSEPPPSPQSGTPSDFDLPAGDGFGTTAMEIRFVEGGFYELGAAAAWFRLRMPLVAGETPSPLQRLFAAADFPNGVSAVLPWDEYVFINPDLTVHVEREPVGEWVCVRAATRVHDGGHGLAEAVLYDERGRVGRSVQSLLVTRRS